MATGKRDAAQFDLIIVGAGVGGAACAVAFASHYPLRILVLERHAGPGNINRGDSLLPTITRHFSAWGILERLYAAGARPLTRMHVFHHRAGLLLEAPLPTPGAHAPYLVLPHPEIERVLAEAAQATTRVDLRYGTHMRRLVEHRGRVHGVVVTDPVQGEHAVYARLVIGADGATSAVRTALQIPLARTAYDHSFFVVDMERPRHYEDAMRVELHPAGGILVVPGQQHVALAALIRHADAVAFRRATFTDKITSLRQRSPLLTDCRAFPSGAHLYKLSRAHAPRYIAHGVALLGDAIHVTNPTAGQGMTMAIADAAALARHLGPALVAGVSGRALDSFLLAYERERWTLNAYQMRWSHWMSRFYALGGACGDLLHQGVFLFGASALGRCVQQHLWTRLALRQEVD